MVFTKEFLVLDDNTAIALKFVESMRYASEEDLTVAKLKDDLSIDIIMISGNEYTISVKRQFNEFDWRIQHMGLKAGRDSIFDKWCYILTEKPK